MTASNDVVHDPHYSTPIYHKAEAAHIIAFPPQTFRNWSVGYAYKRLDGSQVVSAPIVTTLPPTRPRGVTVPFVGLAEAYIIAAFTRLVCRCSASARPSSGCKSTLACGRRGSARGFRQVGPELARV